MSRMPAPALAAKCLTASSRTSKNFSNSGKDDRRIRRFFGAIEIAKRLIGAPECLPK
jgi:hypothetical protein